MIKMLQWLGSVGLVGHLRNSFSLHDLQKEGGQWRFAPGKVFELSSGAAVASKVAYCRTSGKQAPFLLVKHHAFQDGTETHELLRYDTGCLTKHSQFEIAKFQLPEKESYCILDGPSVIWSEAANIHLGFTSAEETKYITRHSVNVRMFSNGGFASSGMEINKFWAFDWNENEDETASTAILLFIRLGSHSAGQVFMETSSETHDWLLLLVTLQEDADLQIERLQDESLIPSDYGYIATCIAPHRAYSVGSCGEVVSKCQFIVGTSYQQVVIFDDGRLVHCVSLLYVPEIIVVMETMDNEMAVAVQCSTGDAHAFKITDNGPLEYASWQDVSGLLTGDFLCVGHDQLLVTFRGDGELSRFLVTDLVQFTADSESQQVSSDGGAQSSAAESLVSAVKALQVRKQTGEAYLTDMTRELHQKSQLLESSISIMKSLESADNTIPLLPKPDPTLVCLLPGNIDLQASTVASDRRPLCSLKLLYSWQRIVDGHWVIGIVVRNQTSDRLCEMGLSLVASSSGLPQECVVSQVLWTECMEDSKQSGPPSPKKPRHDEHIPMALSTKKGVSPGGRFCCVLKTPLPTLTSHSLETTLVCSWRTIGNEGTLSPGGGRSSCYQLAGLGTITLSVDEISSCNLNYSMECLSLWNGEEFWPEKGLSMEHRDHQDLACLLSIRSFIKLQVHSTFTNLLRLPAMLKARLPLPSYAIYVAEASMGLGTLQSSTKTSPGSLEGVALHLTPDVHDARIGILYKNPPQLVLLVKMMLLALPEDVRLSVSPKGSPQWEVLASCLKCVKQELDSKSELMEQQLQQLKEGGGPLPVEDGDGCGIRAKLEAQTNTAVTTLMYELT